MTLEPVAQRVSHSIPIYINLQSHQRRQGRQYFRNTAETDGVVTKKSRPQMTVSSAGEDRAVLLAYTMMGFSVLMFFLFGITLVKPYMKSDWTTETNCTLLQANMSEETVDCKEQGRYPCVEALVNLTLSGQLATLRYTDEDLHLSSRCFHVPRCPRSRAEVEQEAEDVLRYLRNLSGSRLPCLLSAGSYPGLAVLTRRYERWLLPCMLSSALVLLGGVAVLGLVRLTQHLAQACEELEPATSPEGRPGGKQYQLLKRKLVEQ